MSSASFPCVACPTEDFRSRIDLSKHYAVAHKSGKIPCPHNQCKAEISTKANLKRHLKIHDPIKILKFKCTVDKCEKMFYTATEASRHATAHSTEKPFPCPLKCGKFFKSRAKANSHILSHSKEKPYKCGECGQSFGQKTNLNRHIQHQHTFPDKRPHKCSECGLTFKTIHCVKSHVSRMHTNQKKKEFLCSQCPKTFFSKTNLIQHSRTHNSERKLVDCYFCSKQMSRQGDICSYASYQSGNLRRHSKRVH